MIKLLLDSTQLKKKLIYLEKLDETHRDAATTNKVHKHQVKTQYKKSAKPRVFSEGDLVLGYDPKNDTLGARKFVSMCLSPFIVKRVLGKGDYELINYEGNSLGELKNGLYMNKYYS